MWCGAGLWRYRRQWHEWKKCVYCLSLFYVHPQASWSDRTHLYFHLYEKIYQVLCSEYIQTSSKSFHAIYIPHLLLMDSHIVTLHLSLTLLYVPTHLYINPVPTAPFPYCLYVSGLVSDKRSPNQYHWTYSWHACLMLKRRPFCRWKTSIMKRVTLLRDKILYFKYSISVISSCKSMYKIKRITGIIYFSYTYF